MDDLHQIEQALLAYWTGNPDAADTLEGISRWWLPAAEPHRVAMALDRMVKRGIVCSVPLPGSGRVLYKRVR